MRYDGCMKTSRASLAGSFEQDNNLLGGISVEQFLEQYWQKRPLLIRQAMPGFTGVLEPNELAGLACEEEAQSRLISYKRGKWLLEQGPFDEGRFARLAKTNWTLLVQGVNHFLPEAADLLKRFNFIPYARLDDLMVSYAPDGGGVGPHFDSYDVFLLQGMGKRRWRISQQKDISLVEDAPLRILKHFDTQQEYILEPGDMLYLPPQVAHWGVALGDCMTYSIGFRAPSAQELAQQFLSYLQENINLDGMYSDQDLELQENPAEISNAMVVRVHHMLSQLRWDASLVGNFLGEYLSEPKPHIVFDQPAKLSIGQFSKKACCDGLRLDLKSQALFYKDSFFINGERVRFCSDWDCYLKMLANERHLPASVLQGAGESLLMQFHQWFLAGYIQLKTERSRD
jgi:50S ribosomal protein L16 3-hydroxylase